MHQKLRVALRRGFAGAPLLGVALLAAAFIAGCDKTKEEPLPPTATVVMPGSPAPTDASSAPSVAMPTTLLGSSSNSDGSMAPRSAVASGGITRGDSGPPTGGTLSIIPGSPAPAPVATPPPATRAVAPASPLDPTVLPPALSASPPGPGRIGADPAASSSNDQPQAVAPGTKN
jgi:hypothetical protein